MRFSFSRDDDVRLETAVNVAKHIADKGYDALLVVPTTENIPGALITSDMGADEPLWTGTVETLLKEYSDFPIPPIKIVIDDLVGFVNELIKVLKVNGEVVFATVKDHDDLFVLPE